MCWCGTVPASERREVHAVPGRNGDLDHRYAAVCVTTCHRLWLCGADKWPCRVSSKGMCYEKNVLGDCPAGTAECIVPSLNTLDIDTEAALLQFELAGVNVEDEELMRLLVDSIATSANVAEGQVVILGIASVLEDNNGVAALDNNDGGRAVWHLSCCVTLVLASRLALPQVSRRR